MTKIHVKIHVVERLKQKYSDHSRMLVASTREFCAVRVNLMRVNSGSYTSYRFTDAPTNLQSGVSQSLERRRNKYLAGILRQYRPELAHTPGHVQRTH